MSGIALVLGILASYRLSHMIATEKGPYNIFKRIQVAIGLRYGTTSWQYEGITCVLCVSFWLSALIGLVIIPELKEFFVVWWAIAGGVVVVHKWSG